MILFILSPFLAQEVAEVGVEEPVSFRAGSGSLRGPGNRCRRCYRAEAARPASVIAHQKSNSIFSIMWLLS